MNRLMREELQVMAPVQLHEKLEELRRALLELRLSVATKHVKSFPSMQQLYKRNIARVLTVLSQKQ